MRKWMKSLVVVGVAFGSAACATLFSNSKTTVQFESEPSGATVKTQAGRILGTTPFTQTLDADEEYTLIFSVEGYQDQVFDLDRTLNKVAILNLGCVLCWGIDFLTGAMWELDEEYVRVTLSRRTAAVPPVDRTRIACGAYYDVAVGAAVGVIDAVTLDRSIEFIQSETGIPVSSCTPLAACAGNAAVVRL